MNAVVKTKNKQYYDYKPLLLDFSDVEIEICGLPMLVSKAQLQPLIDQISAKLMFGKTEIGLTISAGKIRFTDYDNSEQGGTYQMQLSSPFIDISNDLRDYYGEFNFKDGSDPKLVPDFRFETNLLKLKTIFKNNGCDLKISINQNSSCGNDRFFDIDGPNFKDRINWDFFQISWHDLNTLAMYFNHNKLMIFANNLSEYEHLGSAIKAQGEFATLKTLDDQYNINNLYYRLKRNLGGGYDNKDYYRLYGLEINYQKHLSNINAKLTFPVAYTCISITGYDVHKSGIAGESIDGLVKAMINFDQKQFNNRALNWQQMQFLIEEIGKNETRIFVFKLFDDKQNIVYEQQLPQLKDIKDNYEPDNILKPFVKDVINKIKSFQGFQNNDQLVYKMLKTN